MPTMVAQDDFNRSNENPLNSNWTGSYGVDLEIVSQEVTADSIDSSGSMYWNEAIDDAQYVQCEITIASAYSGPVCRASSTDWVAMDADENSSRWIIEWYNGGSWTQIGSVYDPDPVDDDIARIEADGTGFEGFVNSISRISGSNGSAPSSGYGGLWQVGDTGRLDDFEVGNLADAEVGGLASRRASGRGILRGVSRGVG